MATGKRQLYAILVAAKVAQSLYPDSVEVPVQLMACENPKLDRIVDTLLSDYFPRCAIYLLRFWDLGQEGCTDLWCGVWAFGLEARVWRLGIGFPPSSSFVFFSLSLSRILG